MTPNDILCTVCNGAAVRFVFGTFRSVEDGKWREGWRALCASHYPLWESLESMGWSEVTLEDYVAGSVMDS